MLSTMPNQGCVIDINLKDQFNLPVALQKCVSINVSVISMSSAFGALLLIQQDIKTHTKYGKTCIYAKSEMKNFYAKSQTVSYSLRKLKWKIAII